MAEPYQVQPLPPLLQRPSAVPAQPESSPVADLALSWEIGWEQMKGVPAWMKGVGASLLEKAGFEDAARYQRISARNLVTEMSSNIHELESLYSGPTSFKEAQDTGTIGSYAMWGINETIKQVPNLAVMAMGALVSGGAFTPALLGRFAIARGMSALPFAAGSAVKGAQVAGVGLSSALLNTGEIYSSALLESGENNPMVTGLAGLIAGSLDLWPGSKVIRAMGKNADLGSFVANKLLADKKWRSRFYRALELGATEAMVEDIQTVIEAVTINYLNSNDLAREYVDTAYGFIPLTADQVAERMEARAAGGLLGGLLGFPGRTVTKIGKDKRLITQEDMRQLDDQLATVTVSVDGQPAGTYQQAQPRPSLPPTSLTVGAPQFGADTVEATSAGEMNPFATTPPDRLRQRVTSMDLHVTRRRLAPFANKTTQEAANVLDSKPETPAQRRRRVAKEKKAQAKEAKVLEAQRRREQADADLRAGLAANIAGVPIAQAGAAPTVAPTVQDLEDEWTIAPTVSVTYGGVEAAPAVSEEAKKSPYTVVQVGRGPGTYEYDLDRSELVGMMLDDVRKSKIAAEQAELEGLQKSLMMQAYLKLGDKPKGILVQAWKKKLLGILENLGLNEKDISIKELGPDLNSNSSVDRLEEAIKNFIGKDLLFSDDMTDAYTEDEIRDIIEANKVFAIIDRAEKGDQRALGLFEKFGIPLQGVLADAQFSLKNAIEEAKRRAERKETAEATAKEALRVRIERGETAVIPKPTEKLVLKKKIRAKRKEAPLYAVRARGIPSEEKAKGPTREVAGPEPVTITYADVEAELKSLAPESDALIPWKYATTLPVSDSEADNYLKQEVAYTLVWNAFTTSELGESIFLPSGSLARIGPETIYQNAQMALEKLFPEGSDLYSLEYYKEQKFDPESDLGKLLGDKTLGDVERDIGKRLAAKRKGVWGKKDWESKITNAEIDAEAKKIIAFSPAGTYVLRQKPPRKKILMEERDEKGDIILFNEDEVFKLDEKGNVIKYDEAGLKVGTYDPSSTIKRGEGQPKIVLKEPTKLQRTQLPDRLIGYDKDDQLILEQFVDDERNFRLIGRLELLKKKYGPVKDIPMSELAKVAREFAIGSKFVGVITQRGRAKWVSFESSEVKPEDVEGAIWYKIPDKEKMSRYLMLTDVGTRYQDIMNIDGMASDAAWEMSLSQEIETMQKMANIRYDQIVANNELLLSNVRNDSGELSDQEVKAAKRELDSILAEEEAVFDAATRDKVVTFANENRAFITDPENVNKMPPLPKGEEVGTTQVYNSLRNSASQGKRSFYTGEMDESESDFIGRFSVPPRTPRIITPGTKVTLTPSLWETVYSKDPLVQALTKHVLRMEAMLGDRAKTKIDNFRKRILIPLGEKKRWDEGDVVLRYQFVDTSETRFEAAVDHIVSQELKTDRDVSPVTWSDSDIRTVVEGLGADLRFKNKKGEWVAPLEIDPQYWRERFERSYWETRKNYFETLSSQDLKTEAERRRDTITRLFKKRAEEKKVTVSIQKKPDNWKAMSKEEKQKWLEEASKVSITADEAILLEGYSNYKMMLDAAIGNITSTTYNVERATSRVKDKVVVYTIKSDVGYTMNVPETALMVVKFSQLALKRIQTNELYRRQLKARNIAKRGTRDLPSKLEKLRQAKARVQEKINKELNAVTLQENKEQITPAKAERDREKIRGKFTGMVFDELKDITHAGVPFISLPKDIKKKVDEDELTYTQGVNEYIASIKKRFSETGIARRARLRREHLEDEDRFLIETLQTMDGKWRKEGTFKEGSKNYIEGFEEQVKRVSLDLNKPFHFRGILKPKGFALYKVLQERHAELMESRALRQEVRPERLGKVAATIFEGKRLPTAWAEGRYWEFVQSRDEITSTDENKLLKAVFGIGAAPRMRWKNAYGVIIDKIQFNYTPNETGKEEAWVMYEAIDPFIPENSTQFSTLQEAKAAFGKAHYYRKLGGVTAVKERTPPPEALGRFPKFPKRNLKPDTKGRPKPPVTNAAPLTTNQVMEDNAKGQTVVVTVLSEDSNRHKIEVTKTYTETIPAWTAAKRPIIPRVRPPITPVATLSKKTLRAVHLFAPGKGPKPPIVKKGVIKKTTLPPGTLHSYVLDSSYTDGAFPHTLSAEENEGGSSRESVVDRLNEAFGREVFNYIHVVQSFEDLPLDYRLNRIGYDTKIRGVTYNTQIYLVADNLPMDRVVPVSIHEIGAHGMQSVMGNRFYQKLMAQVAVLVNTDAEIGAIYDRLQKEMDTKNESLILEEVMAHIVENEAMSDSTFWRAVVDAILYGLARLKLWLNPKWIGSAEILIFAKAAARRHFNLAKNGAVKFEANFLNTFLYSGDFGNRSSASEYADKMTAKLREKAGPYIVEGFQGNWFQEDLPLPTTWWENLLIVRDVTKLPAIKDKRIRKIGKRRYQIFIAPNVVKWIADYFIILRHLEESIKARGGVITPSNMPSLYHGAYKNIVNTKRKKFHNEWVIPMQKFMRDKKIDGDDLHWYLYANHAESRNRVHAGKAKKQGVPTASGLFNTEAEAEAYNAENGTNYKSAEGVMKRLRNTLGEDKFADLENAAEYVYRINNLNLNMQLTTGMLNLDRLDDKQRAGYEDKEYQRTYVPLKGDNLVIADRFFEEPLGPGKIGVSGPESRAVHGRVSEAENTWAWSIMNMDYEIDRVEKNRVVMAFAQLINDNKENLKDFATVVTKEAYEKHIDPVTGKTILGLHEAQQTNPDHNIHFKSNGTEFVILVTDKRIGQAFNRTNMTDSGVFLQLSSMVNRWFSAVHTSINPEFVVTNFIRDFQTAMFNLQGVKETTAEFKDAEALGRKVFKDIKNAGVGLKRYIRDEKTDTEWSALAEEFSLEGGRIDFFAFKDVRDFEKKLKDYIKDTTAAGAKRWTKEMIGFIGDYNAVVENTMRLSTYKNAKEAFIANGMSQADAKRKAAEIARNLTVNFSQKGEKGAALNALYLFFNASVQGTVRLFQAMFRRPTGKRGFTRVQKIAGSIMLYSFAQAILNSMLAGDDEDGVNRYRQIDLRSRGRTAHIYLPGFDTFFKIPLPYGYNIFHAIGDTLAALMMGHTNPGRATMHVMGSAAESFMPFSFGSSDNLFKAGLKAVSPTFSDPLVDLALNESYFGQPIYKDPVWGSSDPPSERYWSSTGTVFKGVSRALNALSFGSRVEPGFVSIPPDVFEYLWESIGGGAARFAERTTDLVWMIGPGRLTHRETGEVKWNKVPFARRFFHDETATRNRFVYDKFSEYEKAITTAVGMNTGILEIYGREKGYENFKESEDYKLYKLEDYRRKIVGSITKLQKERNKISSNRLLRNDIKEERMNRLNDRMRDLRIKLINKVDEVWE